MFVNSFINLASKTTLLVFVLLASGHPRMSWSLYPTVDEVEDLDMIVSEISKPDAEAAAAAAADLKDVITTQVDVDANNVSPVKSGPRPLRPFEYRALTFRTHEENETAKTLGTYFELREPCPFELNVTSSDANRTATVTYCRSAADYLFCFPSSPVNTTIVSACPFKRELKVTRKDLFVSKTCKENGEWTHIDYSVCLTEAVKAVHRVHCRQRQNNQTALDDNDFHECEHQDEPVFKLLAILNLVGFGVTLFFVSIAIIIFLSIRSLRCTRNMIHCNMLLTFFFKSGAYVSFYAFGLSQDTFIIAGEDNKICLLYMFLLKYSVLCSFFWMMIEALYLITVIVAAYSSNKIKLWWYLILGWIFPLMPMIPYTIITFNSSHKHCSWIKYDHNPTHELIINVPIYTILAINCILLIIILWVIVTKLNNHVDSKTKYSQYKKLIRASLVLFPMFGLTFGVFVWLPSNPSTLYSKIFYFVNVFLQTTQGVWVAFVYCFLNDEVKLALKTKLRSWKVSQFKTSFLSVGTSSARHYSIPTLYTTANSNSTTNRINRHEAATTNPHDPSRLPILQEDKI